MASLCWYIILKQSYFRKLANLQKSSRPSYPELQLGVGSDNPDLALGDVTEELLLALPVSPQEEEQQDDRDGDEGQREVDGEDDWPRWDALRPLVGLAEHGAQVPRSFVLAGKEISWSIQGSQDL